MNGSEMFLVDTNIFLRVLVKEDVKVFEECCQFIAKNKKNEFKAVTGGIVLAEVVWTLDSYYGFSRDKVVAAVESIVNLRGLKVIDDYDYSEAIRLYSKNSVKYIDALLASIDEVKSKQWMVVSYDKDFDKLGVKRVEPGNVLN